MAQPLVCLKMGPSYANLFVTFFEHQFLSQYHGPKPELYGHYIDDCIGATSSTREELIQFITAVNSFYRLLNIPGKFPTLLWLFQTSKVILKLTAYALVLILQTYRFIQLLVVFIFASITRQEFHIFFTVSQTSSFMQ